MTSSGGQNLTAEEVSYLIHHIVLPPQLPQKDDSGGSKERVLVDFVVTALKDFRNAVRPDASEAISLSIATIENISKARDAEGHIGKSQLHTLLKDVSDGTIKGAVPLEIKAQNAGIIVNRCSEFLTFEFFELSPTNEVAMTTPGRVTRSFPALAAQIPLSKLRQKGLLSEVAYTIARLTSQIAPGFQPQVLKAGKGHDEIRDTTHPGMVTDFLLNVIAAIGHVINVPRISKNTREEVLWCDTLQPWRRSPLWLLIRVSLQLHFSRTPEHGNIDNNLYKAFMIHLLGHTLVVAKDLGSETLYTVSAKISRRIRKWEASEHTASLSPQWMDGMMDKMERAHRFMDNQWKEMVNGLQSDINTTTLQGLYADEDHDLELHDLDAFLSRMAARDHDPRTSQFQPTSEYDKFGPDELPHDLLDDASYQFYRLAAAEKWVEEHLCSWLASHGDDPETCGKLCNLIKSYYEIANKTYSGIPISLSVMYLTILELWIACDTSACQIHQLLLEYSPEVELNELQCLTLPFHGQMKRLHKVELYVSSRRNSAQRKAPSIFRDFGHPSSFAVKYFRQSAEHHSLLNEIKEDATRARNEKCEELERKQRKHQQLMHSYNVGTCEYYTTTVGLTQYQETKHDPNCVRCDKKSQADSMSINIHEWPLSSTQTIAEATVFELRSPKAFSRWRDATAFLIHDVLGFSSFEDEQQTFSYTLNGHDAIGHLLPFSYHSQDIVLSSETKPHSQTHRKRRKGIPTLEDDDICLESGLNYVYVDNGTKCKTKRGVANEKIPKKCLHPLPSPSAKLQSFMYRPPSSPDGEKPNSVIASQSQCPVHMSIDQYKALAAIPLGHNIIYSNILTQLAMPVVDFTKVESQSFILQTIFQAGLPDGNIHRACHSILKDEAFADAIVDQLEIAARRVTKNWESWRSLATFVQLARRVLSLTLSVSIRSRILEYFATVRRVCMEWVCQAQEKAKACFDDDQRTELYSVATEIALVCISTFDVDQEYVIDILKDSLAVSMLIQCSVVIQENKDATVSEYPPFFHSAVQAWRALLYRVFSDLRREVCGQNRGLFDAVRESWAGFDPGSTQKWQPLNQPQEHWLHIESGTLPVHFNLLTAELFVNGLPLDRLPSEYKQHAIYAPLFGKSTLEVMPTSEAGMKFSAKSTYHGFKLYFGMDGKDMLVVATQGRQRFELIPSRLLDGLLPQAFISNFVHWYQFGKDRILFRPQNNTWSLNPEDSTGWRLKRDSGSWRFSNDTATLLNIFSNTAQEIYQIVSPLESETHTHISINSRSQTIEVELPRLQVGFYLNLGDHQLYSRQYPGMMIDSDQKLRTLVGLRSKMVLVHKHAADNRMVLIPEGEVQYSRQGYAMSVSIAKNTVKRAHAYQVDNILGQIKDNGSPQSKLLLCYLHALTSHCLPDPLTGHTGTESALSILRSGAVASFDVLSYENIDVLKNIASLTPTRSYYPAHLKVMQQISWDMSLPSLSQHSQFYESVNIVFGEVRRLKIFHPEDEFIEPKALNFVEPELLKRDRVRTSMFRVEGFGAEDYYNLKNDFRYEARDLEPESTRGKCSFSAATMILREQPNLFASIPRNYHKEMEGNYFKDTTLKRSAGPTQPFHFRFDANWLGNLSKILPQYWCSLHHALKDSTVSNKFQVAIALSTMAYVEKADMNVIQAIGAFYKAQNVSSIAIPQADVDLNLSLGHEFSSSTINDIAGWNFQTFYDCPESQVQRGWGVTAREHDAQMGRRWQANQAAAASRFVSELRNQWPCERPRNSLSGSLDRYIKVSAALEQVSTRFKAWHDNRRFFLYLKEVLNTVANLPVDGVDLPYHPWTTPMKQSQRAKSACYFDATEIFSLHSPLSIQEVLDHPPKEPSFALREMPIKSQGVLAQQTLSDLCLMLETQAKSKCEKDYVQHLRQSCSSLGSQGADHQIRIANDSTGILKSLQRHLDDCKQYLNAATAALDSLLRSQGGKAVQIASRSQHAPRTSPIFWLKQLNRESFKSLPEEWKTTMISYALSVTRVHRAQRLVAISDKPLELEEELRNVGHKNWDPLDFPETLLLEAESGIMIREVQETIADKMRAPPENSNAVMQLNMGEGKSSVIVPIVAAFLANGTTLVRVVVGKPQSKQMFQMLVSKLGGLLNRRIYHMPFSRDLKLDKHQAETIARLYVECMSNGGILLVQPEHILSFKLMGIECLLTDRLDTAQSLLQTQDLLDTMSRDIVDESDDNFSVKFELVYTMGTQRFVELSPQRWNLLHEILALLPDIADEVKHIPGQSLSIEVDKRDGRFPKIRTLRHDADENLLSRLAEKICAQGLDGLPVHCLPKHKKQIKSYLLEPKLDSETIKTVEESKLWADSTKGLFLLARGLIAGGILRFALSSKRWRVNFGLAPDRTPSTKLAVPYRSKDNPSPRSEFSHPDVVLLLTTLAYYYGGLNNEDLFNTLAHLIASDQRTVEYDLWVRTSSRDLPEGFRSLSGVNIKDRVQCEDELFPYLRYSKATIDYFLRNLVFPKEMKEFPHKLSASGWDLAMVKPRPTTGFSGTNDSRHVLPLSVNHLDLPSQSHTNALVLGYLLQQENSIEGLPPRTADTDAEHLLSFVNQMEVDVRVILDVGAQILELDNFQVAKAWLSMNTSEDTKAIVFFNSNDELTVLERSGHQEPFQISPYAKQLEACLIYLDEAHTRGTDLKLPRDYRAAVTLGANVTKDRLVQACMRMRKLGKGQSVVFCVSEEMQTRICECLDKPYDATLEIMDVLCWTISETWADLRRSMPLWATQGRRYEEHKHLLHGPSTTIEEAKGFLEDEAQSVETRYRPRTNDHQYMSNPKGWDLSNSSIAKIITRCQDFDAMEFDSSTLQEEQERELAPEIEEEREVQRPDPMKPEVHLIHADLLQLVNTGELTLDSSAFQPAFRSLDTTSAGKAFDLREFPTDVLVTTDFVNTVRRPSGVASAAYIADDYQRPIQWILSVDSKESHKTSRKTITLVIISPFEADKLYSDIRSKSNVTLHLYSPRINASFEALDDLRLYNIGRTFSPDLMTRDLAIQLNLFAGQVYLQSYQEYVEVCNCLGLAYSSTQTGDRDLEGFMNPPNGTWGLTTSPVLILRLLLMKIRGGGEGIEKTHLGRLVHGRQLQLADF